MRKMLLVTRMLLSNFFMKQIWRDQIGRPLRFSQYGFTLRLFILAIFTDFASVVSCASAGGEGEKSVSLGKSRQGHCEGNAALRGGDMANADGLCGGAWHSEWAGEHPSPDCGSNPRDAFQLVVNEADLSVGINRKAERRHFW